MIAHPQILTEHADGIVGLLVDGDQHIRAATARRLVE
jgi:hypothetical protein